jgi:hypothetical protein
MTFPCGGRFQYLVRGLVPEGMDGPCCCARDVLADVSGIKDA